MAQFAYDASGTITTGYQMTDGSDTWRNDLRPSLTLQFGSARTVWRAGYLFAGSLTRSAGRFDTGYSNQADLACAAQLSDRVEGSLSATGVQGSTGFRLIQRDPGVGQPALRPAGDLAMLVGTIREGLAWEASPTMRVSQGLDVSVSAPQDQLRRVNISLSGVLGPDWLFPRDAVGFSYNPRFALLRPYLADEATRVKVLMNSARASWNHDLDTRWNWQATAGIEHLCRIPAAGTVRIHPTGSATVRFTQSSWSGQLSYLHGATVNIEEGTMSISDEVTLRGSLQIDPSRMRLLAASVGYLRARPLGEVGVASSQGDSVQADVGLTWGLTEWLVGTARYSVARQFERGTAIAPTSLVHYGTIGLTARYGNVPSMSPMPTPGGRVDRQDGVAFPGSERRR